MPVEFIYLFTLLIVIGIVFAVLKRPIYEAMLIGFIVLLIVTKQYSNALQYVKGAATNSLLYAIIAFLALAQLLTDTKVIDSCIEVILSVFGRIKGGTGYVALLASSFMGALSGSAAGNVAATGVFTIPAMKKTGFPPHLAANIVMAASTIGNMIPPAGVIAVSFGVLEILYPDQYSMSKFWILMWGISIWFILQRAITIYFFCRFYKIGYMEASQIPDFKTAVKKGWKGLLIPIVIFLPFFLDSQLKDTLFTSRLAEGAKYISSCTLLFTPGLAALITMLLVRKNYNIKLSSISNLFTNSLKSIVPVSATIFFSYCISNLLVDLDIGGTIGQHIMDLNLNLWVLALFLPLFTAILGMILPGSSQVAIFGTAIIAVMANLGVNPFLVAGMLPVITGAMEGMTPPLALCMYTAMGIAESGMKETTINCLIWVALHYLLSVIMLTGILPVIGL